MPRSLPMRLTFVPLVFAILFGAGCATDVGLAPRVAKSGFDNARTVSIDVHGNVPTSMTNIIGTGLGAQWSEARPDQVILMVAVLNDYTGIVGAELNIDGEKLSLTKAGTVTEMTSLGSYRQSTNAFITSVGVAEKIVKSQRTWLRVQTPTGTMENAVIDGAKDSKAYHALKRFLVEVRGAK